MLIAISDIHGQLDKLVSLFVNLAKAGYRVDDKKHTFVLLGDYIDGGPQTPEVVEYLRALDEDNDNVICLMGNHEDMMIDAFLRNNRVYGDFYVWVNNGGQATLDAYRKNFDATDYEKSIMQPKDYIPIEDLEWMQSLRLSYETKKFIFVHAGLIPDGKPTSWYEMLWIRHWFYGSNYDWGKRVVAGHTYHKEPLVKPNLIVIDTMHHGHGEITAVVLNDDTGEIVRFVTSDEEK